MKQFFTTLLEQEPFIFIKGALIFLIGPLNLQIAYLFLAIGIDLIFGIQLARKNRVFSWWVLWDKLRKKILIYILWIAMFHAFDMIAGLPDSARWAVVSMLAGLEILSAIKNTASLGQTRLADALESLYLSLTKGTPPAPGSEHPPSPEATPEVTPLADVIDATTGQGSVRDNGTVTQGGATNATHEAENQSR